MPLKDADEKDYEKLYDRLEELSAHRMQNSVWLLASNSTAKKVHDDLKQYINKKDRLFVTEVVENHYYSQSMSGTNDWFEDNPPRR